MIDEPKEEEEYVWKSTLKYVNTEIVHYFTNPEFYKELSDMAFETQGTITLERFILYQPTAKE